VIGSVIVAHLAFLLLCGGDTLMPTRTEDYIISIRGKPSISNTPRGRVSAGPYFIAAFSWSPAARYPNRQRPIWSRLYPPDVLVTMQHTSESTCPRLEDEALRVGDIDGRNVVYRLTALRAGNGRVVDFSGAIMLEPHERLIFFENDILPDIRNAGGRKDRFYSNLYPTSDGLLVRFDPSLGWGTMYFTDRRILFLRKPDIDQLSVIYGCRSSSDLPSDVRSRARDIAQSGGMEFIEIPYEDVVRYERGAYSVRIWFNFRSERITSPKAFDRVVSLLDERMSWEEEGDILLDRCSYWFVCPCGSSED
jgi:hypothetical protein